MATSSFIKPTDWRTLRLCLLVVKQTGCESEPGSRNKKADEPAYDPVPIRLVCFVVGRAAADLTLLLVLQWRNRLCLLRLHAIVQMIFHLQLRHAFQQPL